MLVDLNATRVDLVASEHTPYQGANSLALPIREWKSLHGMARAMTSRAGERLRRNATDKQEFEARTQDRASASLASVLAGNKDDCARARSL